MAKTYLLLLFFITFNISAQESNSEKRTKNNYAQNSQILLVKLDSLKILSQQKLLETDIHSNHRYYLNLLSELKQSEVLPSEYSFFENQLIFISQKKLNTKYTISKWLNYLFLITILALVFLIYKSRKKPKDSTSIISLSKQEKVIKNLILQEKSNKEIANELFISLSTVKTHITNIYSKLLVSNRSQLLLKYKNTTGTST